MTLKEFLKLPISNDTLFILDGYMINTSINIGTTAYQQLNFQKLKSLVEEKDVNQEIIEITVDRNALRLTLSSN